MRTCFKYAYAYLMYVHVCRLLEYLYEKFFDIKSCSVNLTLVGSCPTPHYDHYKRLRRLFYQKMSNSLENSESKTEFLF